MNKHVERINLMRGVGESLTGQNPTEMFSTIEEYPVLDQIALVQWLYSWDRTLAMAHVFATWCIAMRKFGIFEEGTEFYEESKELTETWKRMHRAWTAALTTELLSRWAWDDLEAHGATKPTLDVFRPSV